MILYSFIFFFFSLLTMKYKNKSRKRIILESILIFLFGLISLLYFIANYFTKDGINFTVIDTLKLGISNAGFSEYILLIVVSVFSFFFLFILAFFYYHRLISVKEISSKKIKGFLHNSFLFLAFTMHPFTLNIYSIYENLNITQSTDFEQFYKTPEVKDLNFNNKNLVYIYLESFERTYFDNDLFPNLTSNLKNLINKNGIEFTNMSHTAGDDYTIAGMVSTQCGVPLFAPYHGNSMSGVDKFYQNTKCIGDVLKNAGYNLSFLQGSDTSFSGIDKFYKTHSFDEILGKNDFLLKLKDKNYLNGWGLYDDDTLNFVYEKFLNLSERKDKFALFTISLDTHHPNGQLSNSCKNDLYRDGTNPILNTFHCSDKLVSNLIEKIQNSEYGKNTIIVIGSDHLSLANTASDILEKAKERRNLFVVFDPDNLEYKKIDDKATSFDVAPTVLSFLGINTDLGLGRNILISQSLISSFDKYAKKLLSWRETILKFWNFPKLEGSLFFDDKKEYINFTNSKFKLPILIKIEEENSKFYFQEGVPEKLFEQFTWQNFGNDYIYIDNCNILTKLLDTEEINGKLCLAQGKYGKKYKIVNIDKVSEYRIDDFSTFENNTSKSKYLLESILNFFNEKAKIKELNNLYPLYKSTLEEGIIFNKEGYPDFLSNVEGISSLEEWGRWSDARLESSVKFTFKEKLPKDFTLNIETRAFVSNINKKVKVKIGKEVQEFELVNVDSKNYSIDFKNIDSNVIEIIPPNPVSPKSLNQGIDKRELGLGFVSLKISKYDEINKQLIDNSSDRNRFIAHAGGAINGDIYTDSLEALNENYKKGFRLFEIDISETSDGVFVGAHDWETWKNMTKYSGELPPTINEFKKYKLKDKYSLLDISDINKWFLQHEDAILVTDKINEPKRFADAFIDKKRLIMELFSWSSVEEALSHDIIAMPTWDIVNNITGDKVKFLLDKNIKYIAASRKELKNNFSTFKNIKENGIKTYAFHVNYDLGKDETYMLCNEFDYFYGIYADNWDFNNKFNPNKCVETLQYKDDALYKSTLEEGIIFNKEGYPEFLSNVEGIGSVEKWGRWSDAKLKSSVRFVFKDKLPKNFTLNIEAGAFVSNVNKKVKVKIGNEVEDFELVQSDPRTYTIDFKNIDSNVIEIIPPNPVSPKSLNQGDDERELGLRFVGLKFVVNN